MSVLKELVAHQKNTAAEKYCKNETGTNNTGVSRICLCCAVCLASADNELMANDT